MIFSEKVNARLVKKYNLMEDAKCVTKTKVNAKDAKKAGNQMVIMINAIVTNILIKMKDINVKPVNKQIRVALNAIQMAHAANVFRDGHWIRANANALRR